MLNRVWTSRAIEEERQMKLNLRELSDAYKWIIVDLLIGLCILIELKMLPLFHLFILPRKFEFLYAKIGQAVLLIICISAILHLVRIVLTVMNLKYTRKKPTEDSTGKTVNKSVLYHSSPITKSMVGPTMFGSPCSTSNSVREPHMCSPLYFPETSPVKSPSLFMKSMSPQSADDGNSIYSLHRNASGPNLFMNSISPISPAYQSNSSCVSPGTTSGPVSLLQLALNSISSPSFTHPRANPSRLHRSSHLSSPSTSPGGSAVWFPSPRLQYQLSYTPPISPQRSLLDDQLKNTYGAAVQQSNSLRHSESDSRGGKSGNRDPVEHSLEEYCNEHKLSVSSVDRWIVDLRKWMHGTILTRLVDEIDAVNKHLSETSGEDSLIGATTLETLQQFCITKWQSLPSISTLLSFLEFTKDQSYHVNRLRELARGGCIEDYRWDSGSRSESWPWKEHLPNDSLILLNLFATYMDSRMPPHPKCLSGRVFSQLCIVRHPDKPDLKSRYACQIYQVDVQPPHFKLILGGKLYTFPEGRKNLFYAILLLFHHAFTEDGKFKSISLGPSGLNVSWIFSN